MSNPLDENPANLEPARRRWRAQFAGHVIADTDDALILREPGNPLRVYFPRHDVATEYMGRSDRTAYDPHKGSASYYTVMMDGQFAENAVWAYEDPSPGFEALADRMAFFTDKIEVYDIEEPETAVHPRTQEGVAQPEVSQVVQHTDSGSGASQRAHWEATVAMPDADDGGMR